MKRLSELPFILAVVLAVCDAAAVPRLRQQEQSVAEVGNPVVANETRPFKILVRDQAKSRLGSSRENIYGDKLQSVPKRDSQTRYRKATSNATATAKAPYIMMRSPTTSPANIKPSKWSATGDTVINVAGFVVNTVLNVLQFCVQLWV